MTGTASVRIAAPADAEAVAALMTELDHPIEADQARRYLASLAERSDTIVFVASVDECVCGLIAGHMLPVLSEPNPILMIIALSVSAADQRAGTGGRSSDGSRRGGAKTGRRGFSSPPRCVARARMHSMNGWGIRSRGGGIAGRLNRVRERHHEKFLASRERVSPRDAFTSRIRQTYDTSRAEANR
jgi:hypothetical protein